MLQELNHAIDYIEEHLSDDLPLEEISEYVGVSDYHFRTVFFYLAGITLSEYIKNRGDSRKDGCQCLSTIMQLLENGVISMFFKDV